MPTSSKSHILYYSPAANRFVGDAEPYGYVVNMFAFKRATTQGRPYFISSFAFNRANAVRPYRVAVDFCCFIGTPGTALPTQPIYILKATPAEV